MENKLVHKNNNWNNQFSAVFRLSKRIFNNNMAIFIVSVFVSIVIEMIKQAIIYAKENPNIGIQNLFDIFKENELSIGNVILNITLLALVLWYITGVLTKKVNTRDKIEKEAPYWLKVVVLVFFIVALFWYIVQELLNIDKLRITFSGVISFGLFVSLALYFADVPKKKSFYTDTCIAPKKKYIKI